MLPIVLIATKQPHLVLRTAMGTQDRVTRALVNVVRSDHVKALQQLQVKGNRHRMMISTIIKSWLILSRLIMDGLGYILRDVSSSTPYAVTLHVDGPDIDTKGISRQSTPQLLDGGLLNVIRIHDQMKMIRQFDNTNAGINTITSITKFSKQGLFHRPYSIDISKHTTTLIQSESQELGFRHGTDSNHKLSLDLLSPSPGTGRTDTRPTRVAADQHPERLPTIPAVKDTTGWIRTAKSEVINRDLIIESAGTGTPIFKC